MSEPTIDDLHKAFVAIVGNPTPAGDLAVRARRRGSVIRHQRLAGAMTVIVAAGALAMPGLALARHQSTTTTNAGDQPSSAVGSPSASIMSPASTASTAPAAPAVVRTGHLNALDEARYAAAQQALPGFTVRAKGVTVDTHSGAVVGTAIDLVAPTGGGSVKIRWEALPALSAGGLPAPTVHGSVTAWIATDDTTAVSVQVVQGSPPILPGQAPDTLAYKMLHVRA